MMIRNTACSTKASAKAVGGRGLLIALVLAGIGIQGCSRDESPATPVGTDSPSIGDVREDENGVDIIADEPSQGNAAGSEVPKPPIFLAKAAPGCIGLVQSTSGIWRYAQATSGCRTDQRIRFIWRWAEDGPCIQLPPAYWRIERRGKQAYVTELRSC